MSDRNSLNLLCNSNYNVLNMKMHPACTVLLVEGHQVVQLAHEI